MPLTHISTAGYVVMILKSWEHKYLYDIATQTQLTVGNGDLVVENISAASLKPHLSVIWRT